MAKVHVNLWMYDKEQKRELWLQKDLDVDDINAFWVAKGVCFEPTLWVDSKMRNALLDHNKNKYLKFRIVDLLWSEEAGYSIEVEGSITPQAFDCLLENLDEIEDKTGWWHPDFPIKPLEWLESIRENVPNLK